MLDPNKIATFIGFLKLFSYSKADMPYLRYVFYGVTHTNLQHLFKHANNVLHCVLMVFCSNIFEIF